MEKDETKTTVTQQPENSQPMEIVETSDAASGATVEGPGDEQPRDSEGCEAVTVVIVESNEQHAMTAARSVKQNLVGADALVVRLNVDPQTTLIEAMEPFINDTSAAERIILMTDSMILLNPTTVFELGCRRSMLTEKGVEIGELRTPHLMHRSVLLRLLPYLKNEFPHANLMLEYDNYARPEVMPVIMRHWSQDNWLLPIVSSSPNPEAIRKWAATQRFMFIENREWPKEVVRFLEERFPEK